MKTDRRELCEALAELKRVADPKSALQILANVEIRATGSSATLRTTDLSQSLQYSIDKEGDDTFSAILDCNLLYKLVSPKTGKGDVEISDFGGGRFGITVDGITTNIKSLDPDDFPENRMADKPRCRVVGSYDSVELRKVMSYVVPAISTDETREHLWSLHFEDRDIVATDGHRLHKAEMSEPVKEPFNIKADGAKTLLRLLPKKSSPVGIALIPETRFCWIVVGSWGFVSECVEAPFPPYDQVIPKNHDFEVSLDAKRLLSVIKRAMLISDSGMKIVLNGDMTIIAENPELGGTETEVPTLEITRDHELEPFETGFNPGYMTEAIQGSKKTIKLKFGKPLDPVCVHHDDLRMAVIMPMRV